MTLYAELIKCLFFISNRGWDGDEAIARLLTFSIRSLLHSGRVTQCPPSPPKATKQTWLAQTVGYCVPAPGICQKGVWKSDVRYLSDRKCRHRVSLCIKVAILDLNRTQNKPWNPEGDILFPLSEPGLYPDTTSPSEALRPDHHHPGCTPARFCSLCCPLVATPRVATDSGTGRPLAESGQP